MHTYRQRLSLAFRISRYLVSPVLLSWALVAAADYGYDPDADPAVTYQAALQQSAREEKLVLLVFGSDWCPDCRSLNKKLGQAPLAATGQQPRREQQPPAAKHGRPLPGYIQSALVPPHELRLLAVLPP